MPKNQNFLGEYFGVISNPRTYLNFLYLLFSFPLGLAYFIFLVVGFSVGISLIIIWVGLIILAVLFPIIWLLIRFERAQTIFLLNQPLPPMSSESNNADSLLIRVKGFLTNPVTWKGIAFLLLKFPYGIFAFTLITTGVSIALGFIAAPIIYPWVNIDMGFFMVNSFSEALGVALVGILILPGVLHIFNYFAQLFGKFSKIMLSLQEKPSTTTDLQDNVNETGHQISA